MIKRIKKNSGFVLLFAVTLSAILLSVALGVSSIAEKEIKFGTSGRDTNNAFFAADTGIESVLVKDKSGSSSYLLLDTENAKTWPTEIFSGLGADGKSCAKVTITKNRLTPVLIKATVVARGYNLGDSNCNSTGSRVERQLEATYYTGNPNP